MRIWYNHGYSQTRDAFDLLRRGGTDRHFLVATHARGDAPVLQDADLAAVEPAIDRKAPGGAAAYADWCLAFARQHRIDVFVPQRGRGAVARRAADFLQAGVRLILAADADMLDVIEDKARFYRAAADAGLPTPLVFDIASVDDFDAAVAAVTAAGFDACIKPPHGVFGNGYWRLRDDVSLFAQLMDPDAREIRTQVVRDAVAAMGADMPRLLVMQHLPGVEWSIDCICRNGRLITGVARRKHGAVQSIEIAGPALDLAARVAQVFGLSNLVNIQLKSATLTDDAPYVLEINPRMSGGCLYAEHAGLNLPDLQLRNLVDTLDLALPTRHAALVSPVTAAIALRAWPLVDA